MTTKENYMTNILMMENDLTNKLGENHSIQNDIIMELDIVVIGHYGNTVSLTIRCDKFTGFPLYNSVDNIGYIIRAIVKILDKEADGGSSIFSLKGTPVRLVFDDKNPYKGNLVGIGHFMKDRFVLIDDLMKIQKTGAKESG